VSERLKTAAPRATRETTAIFEYVSTPLNFRFYVLRLFILGKVLLKTKQSSVIVINSWNVTYLNESNRANNI